MRPGAGLIDAFSVKSRAGAKGAGDDASLLHALGRELLEDRVGGDRDGVGDVILFQVLQELRSGELGVGAKTQAGGRE